MSADISPKPAMRPRYIGDGVYASFDGFHVWLHLDSHDAPPIVALESAVMDSLIEYSRAVFNPSESSPTQDRSNADGDSNNL